MAGKTIGIVCYPNDVHVELVTAFLRKKFSRQVVTISSQETSNDVALLYDRHCKEADSDLGAIWIRRKRYWNLNSSSELDIDVQLNIAQSNEDALHEFLSRHSSKCINHPETIVRLENKATQLRLAFQAGFTIPETLISASYERVKEFTASHKEVVIKNLRPQGGQPTGTFLFNDSLLNKENCEMSFAIYQRKIEGRYHYRIVVLGHDIYAFRYESDNVDSRLDARHAAEYVEVNDSMRHTFSEFMTLAQLEMGVFDFKESDEGEWYFLEVNQQGAFAYLDALTGFPILHTFAEFLHGRCQEKERCP